MGLPPGQGPRIAVWLTKDGISCWTFSEANRARLQSLLPGSRVVVCPDEQAFLAELPEATVAIAWQFKQQWLECALSLVWIATPAAGRDYFQIVPPPSVEITYGTFHGELIAETVLGMLLGMGRGIVDSVRLGRTDPWPRERIAPAMRPLRGSHAVILGFGHIGTWIGRLLKPCGVRLTGVRRRPTAPPSYFGAGDSVVPVSELDRVLPSADILILSLPGGPGTDHIIDARRLRLLPAHALITNIGRGNAIDESALAEALNAGVVGGACLDVFENEPLPADSVLRDCPGAFLMPHASAISPNYLDLFIDEFVTRFRERFGA